MTNTGPTVLNGDLGVSPGTAITGFPPGIVTAPGQIHAADAVATQAEADANTGYNTLAGLPPTQILTGQDLGGLTLVPGVYKFATSAQLTGTLTLDAQNDPNAMFVFQIGSTLTTASGSNVTIINSPPCFENVFWQVGSSATLGTATNFNGAIVALTSITLDTNATITEGNALALNGAVTLDSNTISPDQCGSISGSVYTDTNRDGVIDAGELGLPGVTVFLDTNGDGVLDNGEVSTISGADGSFTFTDVVPGAHTVVEVVPLGSTQTSVSPPIVLVTARTDSPGVDFGIALNLGQIGGTKFLDINGDGIREAGEIGLGGITVFLDANGDGILDNGEVSTITAADGSYLFANVSIGDYSVREVEPAGSIQTTVNPPLVTVTNILNGVTVAGGDFGNFQLGQITGTKFLDVTGDGPSADDTPLAGVTINLFLDVNHNGVIDAGDGAAVQTTVTGVNGTYSFLGLTAGAYLVSEAAATGFVSTGATSFAASISSGLIVTGDNFFNFETDVCQATNFSYAVTHNGVTTTFATLSGHVHSGDTVAVSFTIPAGTTDTVSLVSYTAPSGNFSGPQLSGQTIFQVSTGTFGPGRHTISVLIPSTFFQVDFVCGSVIPTFGAVGSNIFYTAQHRLISAANGVPAPVTVTISGTAFRDANGNGIADTGEAKLSGWRIFLDKNGNNKLDPGEVSVLTGANGGYKFTGLLAGTYHVSEVLKAGWMRIASATPALLVKTTGTALAGNDFANAIPASISGTIFNDFNGNGVRNSYDTALAGWSVFIDANHNGKLDAGEISVKTDASGKFSFSGLKPGPAPVRVLVKTGYKLTTPALLNLALTSGVNLLSRIFGLQKTAK